MYPDYVEEGDLCPCCVNGIMQWAEVENCSCHINPPCAQCTDNELECILCGWMEGDPIASSTN